MYGKKIFMAPAVMAGLLFASSPAYAEDVYFGVKAGPMLASVSGFDNSTNVGFSIGFPIIQDHFTIEGEVTTAISKGDARFFGDEWDVLTLAGYAVYRTGSSTYFKGKAGLLYEDLTVSLRGFGEASVNDTGLSVGIGIGHRLQSGSKIELELTIIEADITFISPGYIF